MGGRRPNCRLWWPINLFSQTPPNSSFLFGWFLPSSDTSSFDVVVAFSIDESKLTSSLSSGLDLQELLRGANMNMPALLQDKSKISPVGYFEADFNGNRELVKCGNDINKYVNSNRDQYQNMCTKICSGSCSCGCHRHGGIVEQDRVAALSNMWMKLVYSGSDTKNGRVLVLPVLDHLHLNCETISLLDVHVYYTSSKLVASPCKKPKWFNDLHQREARLNLDTVIQAMNSVDAAQVLFDGHRHAECGLLFLIAQMFLTCAWKLSAVSVASLSTFIYIILQSSHLLHYWLYCTRVDMLFAKLFSNSLKNIHYRCCQLLYFLQDHGTRYWSCVEFAEKAAFIRHRLWSSIVVDVLLGNIVGITLWFMADPVCIWVSNFAQDFTNDWLRTGCVWLMGNPAGFKLNTELAGVLGMYYIWLLTSAAALAIDIISLLTMHVLALHLFLSLLYSTQIQALAALWRLFRGRKQNPLRHRLDSYDYTVEQNASIYFIHSTPYSKLFLWMRRKERFPSGIWFDVAICQHSENGVNTGVTFSPQNLHRRAYPSSISKSISLVFFLHINYSNLGEVVWPHYKHFYSTFSRSSISASAYGLLTGRSTVYASGPSIPMKLPWMVIPWNEYWHLCHNSVFSCRKHRY